MRAFLAGILRRSYRVLTAFDGKEGLEKALEILPDVIVSDVMMPRMSGDEMARRSGSIRRRRTSRSFWRPPGPTRTSG